MRRWASSISLSIRSAGRLTKTQTVSASNVSNLNRSSNSVCMVSIDSRVMGVRSFILVLRLPSHQIADC